MYSFSMSKPSLLQFVCLIIGIFGLAFVTTGAQSVGVCYGMDALTLPSEQRTVDLFTANSIGKMRLYEPDPAALEALRGSNIEVILGVKNPQLLSLQTPQGASAWVQDNIRNYMPEVKFRYIAVGNEVNPDPNSGNSQFAALLLPAMQNVYQAIVDAELADQIKVSTATYSGVTQGFPPSEGSFNNSDFMDPIIQFLAQNNLPLLANIYPYFSNLYNSEKDLPYALFTSPNQHGEYGNLFDALLDTMYSAVERSGGPNIEIVVSESGWPSSGGEDASPENAETYYIKLIDHVKRPDGTPKRRGPIETYLFAIYDENRKEGSATEKFFGLFDPSTQEPSPKYGNLIF